MSDKDGGPAFPVDADRLIEAIWTSTKQYALERMAEGGEEPLLPQLPQRICRAVVEEFEIDRIDASALGTAKWPATPFKRNAEHALKVIQAILDVAEADDE